MVDLERRLILCFGTIFPELSEEQIRTADSLSVPGWDSLATVTLINVAEEEFGMQIDVEDIERFLSFPSFLDYLQSRTA